MAGRILMAEDNPINQLVVVRLLQSLGCVVQAVETGQQAVEAVRAGRFDLVLMDVHMPGMDGVAATAAIRRDGAEAGRGQHIPIVALTADDRAGDREKYLAKPITRLGLAAMVEHWVAPSEGDEQDTAPMDKS
jgi:CheY-like chemotaxis protein